MTQKYSVQRLDAILSHLAAERRAGKPWRAIAARFPGIPPGTLCAIYKGRKPKKTSIKRALAKFKPTFEEDCAAYDAWQVAHAEPLNAMVKWAEEKTKCLA